MGPRIVPCLKQMSGDVAELNVDFGAQSAQQLEMDATRFDERKISATTKYDLEQSTAEVPEVCDSEGTIVDVPVVKRCQALIRLGIRDDAPLEKFVLRFERV